MRKYLFITIMFSMFQGTLGGYTDPTSISEKPVSTIVLQVIDDNGNVLASKCLEP